MNRSLPLVAIEIQKEMRLTPELKSTYKDILKEATSFFDKTEQLNYFQQKIDELNKKIAPESVSCKKGCSFCCYHEISASKAELESINKDLSSEEIEKFYFQSQYDDWKAIEYTKRACALLINNECSRYNDRPLICRVTHVSSPAENCKDESGNFITHSVDQEVALYILAYYTLNENYLIRNIDQVI